METSDITIIDQQYNSGSSLVVYLQEHREITLFNEAENNFRKNLLLSIASYFEKIVTDILVEFAKSNSNENDMIVSFIKINGISRKYHTLFDWDVTNANKFFANFGEDFKKKMGKAVSTDKKFEESIKAFLEIGRERNKLVHQNYAELSVDKTAGEIYSLYQTALYFIEQTKKELISKRKQTTPEEEKTISEEYLHGISRKYGS